MNLTQGNYLNTPEEYLQQFTEYFAVKFRPHSQDIIIKVMPDIQISSWIQVWRHR